MVSKRLMDESGLYYYELNEEQRFDHNLPTYKSKSRIFNKIQMPPQPQACSKWRDILVHSGNEYALLSSQSEEDCDMLCSNRHTIQTTTH